MTDQTTADLLVADARRAVHESLAFLAAPEADRVRSLIADLETAVEARTAIRFSDQPAPQPPADLAALRDRIAAALAEADGWVWIDDEAKGRSSMWRSFQHRADAVLAVLPATTDRATVLREAADRIDREDLPQDDVDMFDNGARWATKLLRRMADEAQPAGHQPRRGDQFETWLKAQRDDYASDRANDHTMYDALDDLLLLYRLHADTGTPLGEHVCEGRVAGDCECLEQPAAGAWQDGADR
ncbi:hypothetical protein [Streptomyces leeuwenhoekii]|uniref:Sle1_064 protein n=1 Tax=Streptomyces leeuwenhoekii TaxID=1437453 RepID=A0A0F7VQZ4_STRLW|nr:hypothetical protein [Streptomyces leeuwenhoekii]CQR59231.1 sle1_064 [Streptomyces leeuwenhoekii]